jgi:hydrogenase-4 component B
MGHDPLQLVLWAGGLLAGSALIGLAPLGRVAHWLAVAVSVLGGGVGVIGAWQTFTAAGPMQWEIPWTVPLGRGLLALDALSAVFLLPVFVVNAAAAIGELSFYPFRADPVKARRLRFFLGVMATAMVVVLLARDGVLLLIAWEVMAVAAYFLIITDNHDADARRSGAVYFYCAHAGALALVAMFALWRQATGSTTLEPMSAAVAASAGAGSIAAIFALAIFGFGMKAGVAPLHIWVAAAEADAPSHVSAVMSGALIAMGVYGLVRLSGLLPPMPMAWGVGVMILGVVSGFVGVVQALGQSDIKRVLAYSTIENAGVMMIGLGLAMVGRTTNQPTWIVLGLGGALLHAVNHAMFKPLLFLGAEAAIRAGGTRRLDRLGGLARVMPQTTALMFVGIVAICALPPMNGFVSEFLLYVGLLRTLVPVAGSGGMGGIAFALPALAMIGALAMVTFVRLFGIAFLGHPRSPSADEAGEAPLAVRGAMLVPVVACLAIGLVPSAVSAPLDRAVAAWTNDAALALPPLASVAALDQVGVFSPVLFVACAALTLLLGAAMRRGSFRKTPVWACGYAAPSPRMQYTATSFGQILVSLFSWMLRPRIRRPLLEGLWPTPGELHVEVVDAELDKLVQPAAERVEASLGRLRFIQRGRIQQYIAYVVGAVIVLLVLAYAWHRPLATDDRSDAAAREVHPA